MKTALIVFLVGLFVIMGLVAHTPSQSKEKKVLDLTGEYVLSTKTFISTRKGSKVMSVVLDSKEKGLAQVIVFDQNLDGDECVDYREVISKVGSFLVTFEYVTDVAGVAKFGLPKTVIEITILGLSRDGGKNPPVIYEKRILCPLNDRSFIFDSRHSPDKQSVPKEKEKQEKEVGPDDGKSALV